LRENGKTKFSLLLLMLEQKFGSKLVSTEGRFQTAKCCRG
jgi:hypothetical protein